MKQIDLQPFTNHLGQTISPNQEVIFVVSGYGHNISIEKGTYAGLVGGHPAIRITRNRRVWVDADGNKTSWFKGAKLKQEAYVTRTTLKLDRIYPFV